MSVELYSSCPIILFYFTQYNVLKVHSWWSIGKHFLHFFRLQNISLYAHTGSSHFSNTLFTSLCFYKRPALGLSWGKEHSAFVLAAAVTEAAAPPAVRVATTLQPQEPCSASWHQAPSPWPEPGSMCVLSSVHSCLSYMVVLFSGITWSPYLSSSTLFLTALLRYNLYAIQCTHLICVNQWF